MMKNSFRKVATTISGIAGSPWVFCLAILIVATWAFSGHFFNYSDTWQLVINTGTTIVTFLMVFLIQNTQNRDAKAMQLKLDELIRATQARDSFIDLEDLSDEELGVINEEFQALSKAKPHPAIAKMHAKLIAARHKRKSAGSQNFVAQATHVAGQVIGAIEHLAVPDKTNKK